MSCTPSSTRSRMSAAGWNFVTAIVVMSSADRPASAAASETASRREPRRSASVASVIVSRFARVLFQEVGDVDVLAVVGERRVGDDLFDDSGVGGPDRRLHELLDVELAVEGVGGRRAHRDADGGRGGAEAGLGLA